MAAQLIQHPETGVYYCEPAGPVQAYGTHSIRTPLRVATCREFECPLWETGWTTVIDPHVDQGPDRIIYIRYQCGRRFSERIRDDGMYEFYFYPHQLCFSTHKLPAGDEQFWWRHGDWRGNPTGEATRFQRPDDWVDHSYNEISKWADFRQRG